MATSWQQTQLILCYEQEPYLAFDVTPDMLYLAISTDTPPLTDDPQAQEWLIDNLNKLREDVALIRDHSDEIILVPERRDLMIGRAIVVVQSLLAQKQKSLENLPSVIFNLLARQSTVEPKSPAFEVAIAAKSLTPEEIRAMSSARYLFTEELVDPLADLPPPASKRSKDRSKDRVCISIGAYWRNNLPNGVAIEMSINPDAGQTSLDEDMDVLDQLVMLLAESQPSAEDIAAYLAYVVQHHPEEDRVVSFQVMAAIAYAEEAGHFVSDEFNGMLYFYRVDDKDGYFIDRKDQPSKPPV